MNKSSKINRNVVSCGFMKNGEDLVITSCFIKDKQNYSKKYWKSLTKIKTSDKTTLTTLTTY